MLDVFGIDTWQNVIDTFVHIENTSTKNLDFSTSNFGYQQSSNEMCLTNFQQKTLVSSIADATMN